MYYIDTSAVVELVLEEEETTALRRWMEKYSAQVISSDLLRTELLRSIRRKAPRRMRLARDLLGSVVLVRLPTAAYERAGLLDPAGLRSLDALHLVTALELGDEVRGMIIYDHRLADAARSHGIEVFAPR